MIPIRKFQTLEKARTETSRGWKLGKVTGFRRKFVGGNGTAVGGGQKVAGCRQKSAGGNATDAGGGQKFAGFRQKSADGNGTAAGGGQKCAGFRATEAGFFPTEAGRFLTKTQFSHVFALFFAVFARSVPAAGGHAGNAPVSGTAFDIASRRAYTRRMWT